jgi:AraC-like DNA-binding protein
LVFNKDELKKEKKEHYFLLPAVVLIINLVVYLPINKNEKLSFINNNLVKFNDPFSVTDYFQVFLIAAYYIQFFVYIYLFFRLLRSAQSNMSDKIIDKNIVLRFLKSFIIIVVLYEVIILSVTIYPKQIYEPIMQFFDLLFLIFLGILGINHSTMEIQTRFRKVKFHEKEAANVNQQYIIPESEKKEILELIDKIFSEKKIYKDPNLKLELFAKKIHVSARKLSIVINEITENSFSYLLNHYRIEEAKKLLESSSDAISIEKIYLNTGFNSRSTFNRVFKSFTGVTPKEYISEKIK